MKRKLFHSILISAFLLLISGCDHGLEPVRPIQPGFSGTIHFHGTWPSDTVEIRLIASEVWRQFTTFSEIIALVANTDSIKIYPPPSDHGLPMGRDTIHYTFPAPPSTYRYIAVVQRFGPNIFADWRIIGVFDAMSGTQQPHEIVVPSDRVIPDIDILVDFNNPPPQPFTGGAY